MILLHDGCSLGYDYRDFEVVLDFIESKPNHQFLIYTDERNIKIFENSVSSNCVQFEGYPKSSFSKEQLYKLAEEKSISYDKIFSFSNLYEKVKNKDRLSSGYLKPSHKPYLVTTNDLVRSYREILDKLAERYSSYIVVFSVVSGLKPLSDIGRTPDEQKLEGERQTYPFEEIANVLKFLQAYFIEQRIAVIAISAQYGNPKEIKQLFSKVNQDKYLKFPIETLEEIDWSNKPEQQAALFRAVHERACYMGLPSIAFGNASTYQHLIIAATGGFYLSAVALDSYAKDSSRDGRPYWQELGNGELSGLKVFQQKSDAPGDWKPVSQAIQVYLQEGILDRVRLLMQLVQH
ncbi:MAG: hypothetical protein ACM65K_28545 [Microcoleus sp.]